MRPAITTAHSMGPETMRNSPVPLVMAMGAVLVACSFSLLVLMLLAASAFAVTQIAAVAGVCLAGTAALYLVSRLRRAAPARAMH